MTNSQPSMLGSEAVDQYGGDLAPEQARDAALKQVADNAGPAFIERAKAFVVRELSNGPRSGEDLTDACKRAGIAPRNDKAFGAVYAQLRRDGLIRVAGTRLRRKGHLSGSVNIWELAK